MLDAPLLVSVARCLKEEKRVVDVESMVIAPLLENKIAPSQPLAHFLTELFAELVRGLQHLFPHTTYALGLASLSRFLRSPELRHADPLVPSAQQHFHAAYHPSHLDDDSSRVHDLTGSETRRSDDSVR